MSTQHPDHPHHHHHAHHHDHGHGHPDAEPFRLNIRIVIAAIVVLALVLSASVILVSPGEAIVITRFGNPIRVITAPGLTRQIAGADRQHSPGRPAFAHDFERTA